MDPESHRFMNQDYSQGPHHHLNRQQSFHQPDTTHQYHHHQTHHQQNQALMPMQQQQSPYNNNATANTTLVKSDSSPQSRAIMSSQPTTPQPTAHNTDHNDSIKNEDLEESNLQYPSSPPLPLEAQKYNSAVTPGTPSSSSNYHPHVNTNSSSRDRKESLISETCPSFGPTEYAHNIVSLDRHTTIDVRLHTKVDRGFFLADNDWTCYRRNYFQVSGSFSLEGVGILYEGQEFPCLAKDHNGSLEEIHCFMLGVSARLSDCDKSIQLIQHTPKRDKGPQTTPTPKLIRPGGNIGFSAVGSSQSIVTFERLQFKTATANNGKRRAAQQYYVIVVELLAKLRNGNTITVATAKSSSLVVRGRSPGHYAETDSGAHSSSKRTGSGGGPTSSVIQHSNTTAHVPYGRPTAYAGASAHLFQPTEYMPYDYHGVAYTNYSHMPPPPPMSHSHSYPGLQQQQQQQQPQTYTSVHDRVHSNASSDAPYSANDHHHQPQQHHPNEQPDYSSVKDDSTSSPYYWQRQQGGERSEDTHHQQQQQQHSQDWSRIRMASNNSASSVDNSQHGSPYLNHHQHNQQAPDHYYSHPHSHAPPPPPSQTQNQYGHHPSYGHHHPLTQSLPSPSSSAAAAAAGSDHYPTYQPPQQQQHYEWRPTNNKIPMYTYDTDNNRKEYERPQPGGTPPPSSSSPMSGREATIVK
ncbi:meiosis-specific transcription factor ndt80 [Mucor circinelloides]